MIASVWADLMAINGEAAHWLFEAEGLLIGVAWHWLWQRRHDRTHHPVQETVQDPAGTVALIWNDVRELLDAPGRPVPTRRHTGSVAASLGLGRPEGSRSPLGLVAALQEPADELARLIAGGLRPGRARPVPGVGPGLTPEDVRRVCPDRICRAVLEAGLLAEV